MPEALIDVKLNSRSVLKLMTAAPDKVKRLSAAALNSLAFEIRRDDLPMGMENKIDRPTPFTKRGGRVERADANSDVQEAWVYMAERQDEYLKATVFGGVKTDKLPIPGRHASLNKYGNLPRKATKAKKAFYMRSKRNNMLLTVKRVGGKRSRRIQTIGVWAPKRTYTKTFPFFGIIETAVQRKYNRTYRRMYKRFFK